MACTFFLLIRNIWFNFIKPNKMGTDFFINALSIHTKEARISVFTLCYFVNYQCVASAWTGNIVSSSIIHRSGLYIKAIKYSDFAFSQLWVLDIPCHTKTSICLTSEAGWFHVLCTLKVTCWWQSQSTWTICSNAITTIIGQCEKNKTLYTTTVINKNTGHLQKIEANF